MIEDLIKRHFEATKERGKITDKTSIGAFIEKMHEEDGEALMEMIYYMRKRDRKEEMVQELIDKVMVPLNFLQNIGVDVELAIFRNVQKQESRED
jgi:hypothetical protein